MLLQVFSQNEIDERIRNVAFLLQSGDVEGKSGGTPSSLGLIPFVCAKVHDTLFYSSRPQLLRFFSVKRETLQNLAKNLLLPWGAA